MSYSWIAPLPCAALALALAATARPSERTDDPPDFRREIRPLLSDKCFPCHGPDEATLQADLRLDLREGAFGDLGGYAAITPSDLEGSELWYRINAEAGDRMPPPESGLALTADEIESLRRWIVAGAAWEEHWAFTPPAGGPAPDVADAAWVRNDLDRFVLAALEREGLQPSPEASKETLARRLSLDLTGLPPRPEELDAFLADDSAGAHEALVERLLASPRYGERMALDWLDAARYADSNGYHRDASRTMWLWRDWVIDAFNRNRPYDQLLVEQLAGDLLEEPTTEQLVATGFNRNHMLNDEGGAIADEYQVEYVVDRVRTTSTVFLGLTMGCAQCHDHKYDPITQEEYYSFYAFFNKVPEKGLDGSNGPAVPSLAVPRAEDQAEIERTSELIEKLRAELGEVDPELAQRAEAWGDEHAAALSQRWQTLEPELVGASGGATLQPLDDGSVLAGGKNPDHGTYELVARTDSTEITGLWLEVLTDPSLAHESAGRTSHGNFVLSELEVEATSVADPDRHQRVGLVSAFADYSQRGYEIARAIDGDRGTGWAVDGHELFENRNAFFLPAAPFGFEGGTELRVRMRQHFGYQHTIGRFRVSITTDADFRPPNRVALGNWWTLGPVPGEPDRLFSLGVGPESGVDLDATVADEHRWEERTDWIDGEIYPFDVTESALYAYRKIDSPTERTLLVSMGSDDSIAAWLNGARILTNPAKRGAAADQEWCSLDLRAGENELLVKVVNYGGPGGFTFRVVDEGPAILPGDLTHALRRIEEEGSIEVLAAHFRRREDPAWLRATARIDELERQIEDLRGSAPALMVMRDDASVRMTRILERGQYDRPGRQVTAATPAFLPPLVARDPEREPDRLDLARWMVQPEHPLTARVQVNRVWRTIFGRGLVRTPEDFGAQGEPPASPDLLDWLARHFVQSGWDVKELVRTIVTSATYRQSSSVTPLLMERDPQNLLFARAPGFRLDAELLRDNALSVAGLLSDTIGGPSVKPYQPPGLWEELTFGKSPEDDVYRQDTGDDLYRRGLYVFRKRSVPPPNLQAFDAPTREVCVVRRPRTNTPLQAFVLMNDPTFVEASRALAERTLLEGGDGDDARLAAAFRRATSRRPEADEVASLRALLEEERAAFAAEPARAAALLAVGESTRDESLDAVEHAAWTTVCSTILNLDETITRR